MTFYFIISTALIPIIPEHKVHYQQCLARINKWLFNAAVVQNTSFHTDYKQMQAAINPSNYKTAAGDLYVIQTYQWWQKGDWIYEEVFEMVWVSHLFDFFINKLLVFSFFALLYILHYTWEAIQ